MTTLVLHPLPHPSGSATLTTPHTTLLSSINFPVEAPARHTLPLALSIEVIIRPASGPGGPKERHLEELVKKTLEAVVLVEDFPRQMAQVGVQVLREKRDEGKVGSTMGAFAGQGGSGLVGLAELVNVSVAGCLDAGVPMRGVVSACCVAVSKTGELVVEPGVEVMKGARSLHVLAFVGLGEEGECILVESEGRFGWEEWVQVEGLARRVCLGGVEGEDPGMELDGEMERRGLQGVMRDAVEARVRVDERWKGG